MTMNTAQHLQQINDFEAHYQYDSGYMRDLLSTSPAGYEKFSQFLPMAHHLEQLAPDDYWVAKLATMQTEDCGECLQLSVRMALEAGVGKEVIRAALDGGRALPAPLNDVYRYATCVATRVPVPEDLMHRMTERHDKGSLLEFGLCIASARVFPAIKRAIQSTQSCALIQINV